MNSCTFACQEQKQLCYPFRRISKPNSTTMLNRNYKKPPIKFRTATQNGNPLDSLEKGAFFFYGGNQISCLVNNQNELRQFRDQTNAYVIFELERLELVQNGTILRQFIHPKDFIASKRDERFMLFFNEGNILYYNTNVDPAILVKKYDISTVGQEFIGKPLWSTIWYDYDACRDYAKKFSEVTGKIILVSQLLEKFDRH